MQAATFTAYNDKSSAKRGLVRKFPEYKDAPEQALAFLTQADGKWGFYSDEGGLKRTPEMNAAEQAAEAIRPDPELAAALGQHDEEGNDVAPSPTPAAFGSFALAQLTAPKAPDTTAMPVRPVAVAKIEKNRPESNGVKRPSAGTICAQVWDIAASMSNISESGRDNSGSTPTLSQVVKAAESVGINKFTARTQYARWRVFHGITGRIVA